MNDYQNMGNYSPRPLLDTPLVKTLRDEFAMAALTGIIASHGSYPGFDPHADAFRHADAMMKTREVGS